MLKQGKLKTLNIWMLILLTSFSINGCSSSNIIVPKIPDEFITPVPIPKAPKGRYTVPKKVVRYVVDLRSDLQKANLKIKYTGKLLSALDDF